MRDEGIYQDVMGHTDIGDARGAISISIGKSIILKRNTWRIIQTVIKVRLINFLFSLCYQDLAKKQVCERKKYTDIGLNRPLLLKCASNINTECL